MRISYLLILCWLSLQFAACNNDDAIIQDTLAIHSISPVSAFTGDEVIILGEGFDEVEVLFNNLAAEILSNTNSQIIVRVPDNATDGPITVSNTDYTSESVLFRVKYGLLSDLIKNGEVTIAGGGGVPGERGFEFSSSEDGKIIQLGVMNHVNNVIHTVSLWDVETEIDIATLDIQVTDLQIGNFNYMDITPIQIQAGKRYRVSVSGTSATAAYAFTSGTLNRALTLHDAYSNDAPSSYPYELKSAISGVPDIVFVADK